MKRHHLHKISIAFGILAVILSLTFFLLNSCGQTTSSSGTTSSQSVTVKGVATSTGADSASISGVHSRAALDSATVTIGKCASGSFDIETLATGTTASDGTYTIEISAEKIKTTDMDTNNKLNNVMVLITKGATTVGAVINSLTVTSTDPAYAPTADEDSYKKSLIARKAFEKGMDPKNFDFDAKIDRKFDDMSGYTNADLTKFDNMAGAIKDADAVRDDIATGLGISAAILAQLDAKGKEYHETYIEPLFKTAFENKTPPDQKALDEAFSNMEKYMKDYAISLGLSEQQFLDLKNMYDQQMQSGMKKGMGENDNAYKEMKRRDMGSKMLDLFKAQWDAADVLATTSTSNRSSFKDTNPTAYANFVQTGTAIATTLKDKLNDTSMTNPGAISDYLRTEFFDAYIFPPPTAMPGPGEGEFKQGDFDSVMLGYANSRIMVYFMGFLDQSSQRSIFAALGTEMQPIFQNRFQNSSSTYYMGPDFWAGNPTPEEITSRLGKFKTALDDVVNSIIKTPFETVFGSSAARIIAAFKILNAPPDAF